MSLLKFAGKSLRRQLLLGLTASLLVIMGIAGVVTYEKALHETDEIFSARLATSARVIDTLLIQSHLEQATINSPLVIELPPELSHLSGDDNTPFGQPYETKLALQVWSDDGRLLLRSSTSPSQRLGQAERGFFDRMVEGEVWHIFSLQSGPLWVEVAEKEGLRSEVVNEITSTVGRPFIVAVLVLLLFMNLMVRLAVRPLARLGEQIELREPDDLRPVVVESCPAELNPVVKALNDLLTRIKNTIARERRFTDSAAHEMRTPLAALTIHAENAANAVDDDERAISLAQLLTGLKRTNRLVEQMLSYGRIVSGNHGETKQKVNLSAEVKRSVTDFTALVDEETTQFALQVPSSELIVSGYPGLISVLLNTLIENAVKYHSSDHPKISINLQSEARGAISLTIENFTANRLSPSDLDKLNEPYFRPSNMQAKQGNGLGLAIASEIANLHGWKLVFAQNESARFIVKVEFRSS